MLARRSLHLATRVGCRRVLPCAAAWPSKALPPRSLATPCRRFTGEVLLSNLSAHVTQVGACASLSTLLYSPVGTVMLIALAYNVVVICTKHVNYSMEITAKDYVQDQQLYVIMRYGILSCILLGMEVMFVEI